MNKNKIIDYVMTSPYNTNAAILDNMLMALLAENSTAASEAELSDAFAQGKDVILAKNMVAEAPILVTKDSTLDLNRKSIEASAESEEWYMLKADGATLVLDGNGMVSAGKSKQAIPVTAVNGGKVIINGGDYRGKGELQCVYANGGKVEIYGGTFGVVAGEEVKDLLNVQNTREITDIQVYGGRFIGRDPALGDDALGGSFVAPGYMSIEVEPGIFEVVKA